MAAMRPIRLPRLRSWADAPPAQEDVRDAVFERDEGAEPRARDGAVTLGSPDRLLTRSCKVFHLLRRRASWAMNTPSPRAVAGRQETSWAHDEPARPAREADWPDERGDPAAAARTIQRPQEVETLFSMRPTTRSIQVCFAPCPRSASMREVISGVEVCDTMPEGR